MRAPACPRWLAPRWQAYRGASFRERKRPAGAFALIRHVTGPGVHDDRVVGVGLRRSFIARRNAVVPVNRLGVDLDDPDQRLGRHPAADISLRLDRLPPPVAGGAGAPPLTAG